MWKAAPLRKTLRTPEVPPFRARHACCHRDVGLAIGTCLAYYPRRMGGRRHFIVARSMVREMLPTFLLATGVSTFLLLIRSLFELADLFISHSVATRDAFLFLILVLPSLLVLTIPMGLLFAVLLTSARWSGDSELIALQSCGVRLWRVARPFALVGLVAFLLDLVLTVVVMPRTNRAWMQLTTRVALSSGKAAVEPHVFVEDFPGQLLYVDRVDRDTGRWHGILLFDLTNPTEERMVTADSGDLVTDPKTGTAWLNLHDTVTHVLQPDKPDKYTQNPNEELRILLTPPNASTDTRRVGVRGMSSSDLLKRADNPALKDEERLDALVELHKRVAIPAAALIFALVGFPLGVSNRRGGKSFGLTASVALVVIYYVLLNNGELLARSHTVPAGLGMWLPNVVIGGVGLFMLGRVSRGVPIGITGSVLWRVTEAARGVSGWVRRTWCRLRHHLAPPAPNRTKAQADGGYTGAPLLLSTLDRYLLRLCIGFFLLVIITVCTIWVVVDFSENVDDIQKHAVPFMVVASYYFFLLPQILHDTLPIAYLIAFLGASAVLERNNETTAIKAAGVSLSRAALPLLLLGLLLGGGLFGMDEVVVQRANRASQRLFDIIRGRKVARSYRATDRLFLFLPDGHTLVNFLQFDPDTDTLVRPSIYVFDDKLNLRTRYMADRATYKDGHWRAVGAWSRTLLAGGSPAFVRHLGPIDLPLNVGPSYFGREYRRPSQMSFGELASYIHTLREAGYRVDRLRVQLHQKLAYPLSIAVLAWLALPYAFRMGRRGTVTGIAVALVLGMVYFAFTAFVTKLGEASLLPPVLAAWTPTVVFVLLAINRHTVLRT